MAQRLYTEKSMGKCSCNNLKRCSEVQQCLLAGGDALFQGCFEIRHSTNERIEAIRRKATFYLGPACTKSTHIRIRKHHFHLEVLRYIKGKKQRITSAINLSDAVEAGLMSYTSVYENKSRIFVPNISYAEAEGNGYEISRAGQRKLDRNARKEIQRTAEILKHVSDSEHDIPRDNSKPEKDNDLVGGIECEEVSSGKTEMYEDILGQISNIEHAISKSDISIKRVTEIISGLNEKLETLVRSRESLRDHLEQLYDKKRKYIGNYCSNCNVTISMRKTSKLCNDCYHKERDSTRLMERATKRKNPSITVTSLKKKVLKLRRKTYYLREKAKLANTMLDMQFEEDGIISKTLQRVFKSMNRNKETFTNEIIQSTMRVLAESGNKASSEDVQDFAAYTTEQMLHMGHSLLGTQKGNRYSPKVMRMALSVWQRSRSAYEQMQQSNSFMFPTARQLARAKKKNSLHQGLNPKLYSRLYDEFVTRSTGQIVGHVMVDEMQLKSGIYFHSKSHVVTGFATDGGGISIDKEIMDFLKLLKKNKASQADLEDKDKEKGVSTYVNQWRFRSCHNEVRNLEFFFNEGNTTGSEILRQFIHVNMCLTLVNVKVCGITLDASGNNRRFVRYLLRGDNKVFGALMMQTYCRNVFFSPLNYIFIWFCCTHNLKSVRNQLTASSGTEKATRMFHDKHLVYFGWSGVKDQWKREMERIGKGETNITDLSMSSVSPDSWNKMRVTHAKAVFSLKTVSEDLDYYSLLLYANKETRTTELSVLESNRGETLETKRVCLLERRACEVPDVSLFIRSGIACLKYRVHAGSLFNDIFMNRKIHINRDNINIVENKVRYALTYFADWYECRTTRKTHADANVKKMWEKSVMSEITYYVMNLGCTGFVGYCRYILHNNPDIQYVPILHANTSSLESHFSLMRWHHADTPAKYENTFNIADNEKSMKILEKNKMYETHDETYIKGKSLTGDKWQERKQKVSQHETVLDYNIFISAFYISEDGKNLGEVGRLCPDIKKACVYGSFKTHLLEETNFREYCVAALHTTHESFFIYFLELCDDSENQKFNCVCQQIMTHLLLSLDKAIRSDQRMMQSSFWFNYHEFLASDAATSIIDALPKQMRNRIFFASVTFNLVTHFESIFQKFVTRENTTDVVVTCFSEVRYSELHRYVGWAIFSRKQIVEGKIREFKEEIDRQRGECPGLEAKIALSKRELDILYSMSTYEEEIKDDEEYMSTCYPTNLQMYNKGRLTLVAKKFMPWAKQLVISVNEHINIDKIWHKKSSIMSEAVKSITGSEQLYNCFKQAINSAPAHDDKVVSRCHREVIVKTINARAGNVFKTFQMLFVGHYSKKINVELRKTLQVQSKSKHQKTSVKEEKHEDHEE